MRFEIDIDTEAINENIQNILNKALNWELEKECRATTGIVAEAARDIIYSQKDKIVDKVVERATREIVRRGLPKLLERVENDGT